jgi:hypothetical protein
LKSNSKNLKFKDADRLRQGIARGQCAAASRRRRVHGSRRRNVMRVATGLPRCFATGGLRPSRTRRRMAIPTPAKRRKAGLGPASSHRRAHRHLPLRCARASRRVRR